MSHQQTLAGNTAGVTLSAVSDLQYLGNNANLCSDFDALDDNQTENQLMSMRAPYSILIALAVAGSTLPASAALFWQKHNPPPTRSAPDGATG